MTDRELLELAAKAAGYSTHIAGDIVWHAGNETYNWNGELDSEWNPLSDDGDAMRLAVKLNLSVYPDEVMVNVTHTRKPFSELEVIEDEFDDLYAATRRAIVRAAAEIGKNMKGVE